MAERLIKWKAPEPIKELGITTGRSRCYVLTINDTEAEQSLEHWQTFAEDIAMKFDAAVNANRVQFVGFCVEQATWYHLQGFLQMSGKLPAKWNNVSWLQANIHPNCHVRKWEFGDTCDDMLQYINPNKPDGTYRAGPWQLGAYIRYCRKGKSTAVQLKEYVKDIDAGKSKAWLADNHSEMFTRFPRAIVERQNAKLKMQEWKWPLVMPSGHVVTEMLMKEKKRHFLYLGASDCGKSYWRRHRVQTPYFLVARGNAAEGWRGQPLWIFDDVMPKMEDILEVTNDDDNVRQLPARYNNVEVPAGAAFILVIMVNHERFNRRFFKDGAFRNRFNCYEWKGRVYTDPAVVAGTAPLGGWQEVPP